MGRINGHPELKEFDFRGTLIFVNVPEYARNDLNLKRRGTIKVVLDNMAGSDRVGSICFSRQLGLEKLFDFRGALNLKIVLPETRF
jgi:hypothetical protein